MKQSHYKDILKKDFEKIFEEHLKNTQQLINTNIAKRDQNLELLTRWRSQYPPKLPHFFRINNSIGIIEDSSNITIDSNLHINNERRAISNEDSLRQLSHNNSDSNNLRRKRMLESHASEKNVISNLQSNLQTKQALITKIAVAKLIISLK